MKKTIKIISAIIIVLILILLVNHYSSDGSKIKIGVILPMTGNSAKVGADVLAALEIAKEHQSNKYPNVDFVVEDDEFATPKTISSYNKLVTNDKVVAIIGGMNSSALNALRPVANVAKVPILSPGATAASADNFVYKNSHEASKEGGEVARFAYEKQGHKTAALLYMNNDFGLLEKNSFTTVFSSLGGKILSEESFDVSGVKDYKTQLLKIKEKKPELLFIVGLGSVVGTIAKQAEDLGAKFNLFGIYTTEDSSLLSVGGKSIEGLIYSFPLKTNNPSDEQSTFVKDFIKKTGGKPQMVAYNAYDSYSIIIKLVDKCKSDSICINEALKNTTEFSGITGVTKINSDRTLEKDFSFRVIKDGNISEI